MESNVEKIKKKILALRESAAVDSIALDSLPAHVAINKFKAYTEILEFIDTLPKEEDIIDNACMWLRGHADDYALYEDTLDECRMQEDFYEDFRNAMENLK